jgi:RNA polymerase sigma factor (sigma-70 family)
LARLDPMPPQNPEQARWFAEEVQPHEPALRSYLRARFPSLTEIDDLVQETYARLVQARSAGRVAVARPYLFATARNAALDLFRRNRVLSFERIDNISPSFVVESSPDAAEIASHAQEIEMVTDAINALPARCREVVRLRKFDGLSHREIAAKLGISLHTVNAQVALGMLRCRDYLKARGLAEDRSS